jgi:hypothetical protein
MSHALPHFNGLSWLPVLPCTVRRVQAGVVNCLGIISCEFASDIPPYIATWAGSPEKGVSEGWIGAGE